MTKKHAEDSATLLLNFGYRVSVTEDGYHRHRPNYIATILPQDGSRKFKEFWTPESVREFLGLPKDFGMR